MPPNRREVARCRARLYALVRETLGARDYLEVETPCLVPAPGMEPHITAFECEFRPELGALSPRRLYLQSSPEYAMKRLLADGFGHVFQLCKTFRNGEAARSHNPEFTMLELYRSPGSSGDVMGDLEAIVHAAAREPWAVGAAQLSLPFQRLSVRDAFAAQGHAVPPGDDDFFRLFLDEVEPSLGQVAPTFLCGYPASMAALAQLTAEGVADRFELYAGGLELANGFGELNDAQEQRRRLVAEQAQRRAAGRAVYPLDERFLEAVGRMPPSGGVAVGLDRLLMLLLGAAAIEDVLLFPAVREW
ncbi:MAG: EF-P lysine aminoacylase GenX [Deltaproteobacteria bacterium]